MILTFNDFIVIIVSVVALDHVISGRDNFWSQNTVDLLVGSHQYRLKTILSYIEFMPLFFWVDCALWALNLVLFWPVFTTDIPRKQKSLIFFVVAAPLAKSDKINWYFGLENDCVSWGGIRMPIAATSIIVAVFKSDPFQSWLGSSATTWRLQQSKLTLILNIIFGKRLLQMFLRKEPPIVD